MSVLNDPENFYYNEQLKKYLVQFMAIFADMNVRVGWNEDKAPRLAKVPVYGASKDRIVGAIKGENTQNKPIRLPAMSASISNFDLAPDRRKGVPNHRRQTMMPTGGLFPGDMKVVEQRMPVPYELTTELTIWASNQDQHYQILEQILMIFNPILQIQTSDDPLDWTQITTVELAGIRAEENVPPAAERRLIQTTLEFKLPIHISAPANVHDKYIRDIFIRVGTVSQSANTSYEIVGELDAQGIPYELEFTLDDVNID